MGRLAFATAMVSVLVIVSCMTAGLVSAGDQAPGTLPSQVMITQTSVADLVGLIALYNATDGPNWRNNTNWLSETPVGEWYGVSVDSNGRVVGLNLYQNELSGIIPSELGKLTNLRWLSLYDNQLSGEIPPELGELTKLESLDLWSNQLSGEIPPELGELANLQSLWLYNNQLTGEIPSELGSLGNLAQFSLGGNQLSGGIPSELGNLANLEWLVLSYNQLSGGIPSELGNLANLEWLGLSHNQLSGEIPSELGNLPNLQRLGLNNNQLSGEIPSELGELANLRRLYLYNNQLSGEIPSELGNLANLQTLWLDNNQLSGEIPPELGNLGNLQRLWIENNQLSGEIPPELEALANLEWLALSGNQLEGCIPMRLQGVENNDLGELGLLFCDRHGDPVGNVVTGVKVEAAPNFPNTVAKWVVQFQNGTIRNMSHANLDGGNTMNTNTNEENNILNGGTGKDVIMIEFEDDVQFPDGISPNDVVITANMVWDGQVVDRTVVANPLGVDIVEVAEFAGYVQQTDKPPDETLIMLEIPDMEPAADRPGFQGIAPGATVTVTFRQTAGIKNPTESKPDEVYQAERAAAVDANGEFDAWLLKPLSGYKVQVATSNNGYFVVADKGHRAVIPRRLLLSDMDGPRGSTVTAVGMGFRNSVTASVWNDKNQNGVRDSNEIDLGAALIAGSDDFITTITINNPPFNYDLASNGINAVDGRNRTIIPGRRYTEAISGGTFTESIPKFLLESSIKVMPGTAAIRDTVQVTGRDLVAGGNIAHARVSVGGMPVTDYQATVVSSTGGAIFELTIPEGVSPGVQELVIKDGPDALNEASHNIVNGEGARTSIVIIGGVIPGALDTPIIWTPIVAGDHSLTVSWDAPVASGLTIAAYDLRYIRTDADETMEANWTLVEDVWTIGFNPLEYMLTGLTAGAEYDVQLRSVNAAGNSLWSAAATGTPSTWGAVRSFSQGYVEPGGEAEVTITAAGYGLYGHVAETLPPGFSYTRSDLNEEAVIVSGRNVIFFLLRGEERFTYTVTASSSAGEYPPPPPLTSAPAPSVAGEYPPAPTPTPPFRPRPRRLRAGDYSFSGGIVNENRLQQTVGGAASIKVGAGPLVYAINNSATLVRIDSSIPVTVTFSEPVSGFNLDDINAANGAVSNFSGSGAVYSFHVIPNAIGEVTVDIAAGAATDAEGNGNMAAPQLLLGIPYDDDHDGAIGKDEAIAAVIDYFDSRITKEQAIAVITLYFSS